MDAVRVARSLRGSIGMLAMDWLMAADTLDEAAARGLPEGPAAYASGRFGVLGDCPVDNVVGAAFFWEPGHIADLTVRARSAATPAEGAAVFAGICEEWGDTHLTGFDGAERLGELLDRVVAEASPLGAPLFAGWREHVGGAPGPGRTFLLAQTMRELRFSRHCVAVQAAGMTPLEAILTGPAGEWNAKMFGWPEPYPDVSHLATAREAVEAHTDRLHAVDLAVLDEAELAELRGLSKAALGHRTR